MTLLNQLQLSTLNPDQQVTNLAKLLAATIHLQSQYDDDLQRALLQGSIVR